MNDFVNSAQMKNRISQLEADGVDVPIQDAVLNAAGLYRAMSEQHVSCFSVDNGQFSSATSAAPSRFIHPGL